MMPTSATGTSRRGFTLVELLVVVTVIGVAATAVVLAAPDPRPSVSVEAERLAARLVMARDEAILGNRSVAARIDTLGYEFQTFDGADWHPLTGVLKASTWADGVDVTPTSRMVFDPTGATEPVAFRLSKGARSVTLKVDGAGEISLVP